MADYELQRHNNNNNNNNNYTYSYTYITCATCAWGKGGLINDIKEETTKCKYSENKSSIK